MWFPRFSIRIRITHPEERPQVLCEANVRHTETMMCSLDPDFHRDGMKLVDKQ